MVCNTHAKNDVQSAELNSFEDLEAIKTFSEEVLTAEKAKRSDYNGEAFMLGKQLVIKWIRAQDVAELNNEMVTAYLFGQEVSCLSLPSSILPVSLLLYVHSCCVTTFELNWFVPSTVLFCIVS